MNVFDTAVFDFFNSISAGPNDYLFFEIVVNVGAYAWCGQQAGLYRDAEAAFIVAA